jgi:hypothetical protein
MSEEAEDRRVSFIFDISAAQYETGADEYAEDLDGGRPESYDAAHIVRTLRESGDMKLDLLHEFLEEDDITVLVQIKDADGKWTSAEW